LILNFYFSFNVSGTKGVFNKKIKYRLKSNIILTLPGIEDIPDNLFYFVGKDRN